MEIKEVKEQHTLMKRFTTPVGELSNVMGTVYGEIAAHMQQHGIPFAGPPFALYHNMDMEALDMEIRFPVLNAVEGSGEVKAGKIPGGKVATTIHAGPYSTMEETYTRLMGFVDEKKLTVTEWMYETYLNSPEEVPEAELRTEVFLPIAE